MLKLCPSQQEAFDDLVEAADVGSLVIVSTKDGMGKTAILEAFHKSKPGSNYLKLTDFIELMKTKSPFQFEEALEELLMSALAKSDIVILDDIHLIYGVICGCGYNETYPRMRYADAILMRISEWIGINKKTLVLGNEGSAPGPLATRCFYAGFKQFKEVDYQFICKAYLGERADSLDMKRIYRFAPKLSGHQLKKVCQWFNHLPPDELNTVSFVEYLRKQQMASNVDLGEVEAVDLRSLRGVDDIIESLEANIIVPLEEDELSAEFGLRPKRGVLLAGPPGTGKTTVGRALAHRLKSKFFLVDGTFISGSNDFYRKISRVFEAAKQNSPAIIFIDDSDVIFENKEDFGLYRYLLTMLDGLESESNKRVCVMMTTMDVASVPPALVRSGRIELWLETRLPDKAARVQILNDHISKLTEALHPKNIEVIAEATEGLTGADLKRLVDDTKILVAYDRARKLELKENQLYYEKAIETIKSNKQKYAAAETEARARQMMATGNFASAPRYYGSYDEGDGED